MSDDTTDAPKRRGHAHSEETKEKIRQANTGKKFSDERKANISSAKLKSGRRSTPACHPDRAACAMGLCRPCYAAAYGKKYRAEHTAETSAQAKAWAKANPERRRATRNASAMRHPETRLAANLRKTLAERSLSGDGYTTLLVGQEGVCAICDQECQVWQRLSVDHDHLTGAARGLLCHACNTGIRFDNVLIGRLRDDAALNARALLYLAKHANQES